MDLSKFMDGEIVTEEIYGKEILTNEELTLYNTLQLEILIQLLTEKGIIGREEFSSRLSEAEYKKLKKR